MRTKLQSAEEINASMYRFDNVHNPVPSLGHVTEEHISHYREQGFLAVENVLNAKDIRLSIEAIMDIIVDRETKAKVQFTKPQHELKDDWERELAVRKVYDYVEVSGALRDVAFNPQIVSLAEKLLGAEARLAQNQALLKPPYGGAEKPWHQDMAYGNLSYEQAVVGVWIALDEAGLDNGCMHVIPRSHMDGGIPHYAVRDWQICDSNVPVHKDTAVVLQPGGALFFHGLLFHGTPNNFSPKRRRALQFHYAPAEAGKMSPGEYKRMFTNAMTSIDC